jgi:beta-xylosidase
MFFFKSRTVATFAAILVILILSAASLPGLAFSGESPTPPSSAGWEDPFSGPALDPRWSWIREDNSHWSLSAAPGNLRIVTQTGGLYGTGFYALPNNLLLTDAPSFDFEMTLKVAFSPTAETHTVGLLFYQDDSNYLNMVYVFNYDKWMSFHREISGAAEYEAYEDPVNVSPVYLRIVRQNKSFIGLFSTDGTNWQKAGDFQLSSPFSTPKIGLAAYNGPSGVTEIAANFDYFKVELLQSIFLPVVLK